MKLGKQCLNVSGTVIDIGHGSVPDMKFLFFY